MIAKCGKWWFGTCIAFNINQNFMILLSSDLQLSNLNIRTSHALKLIFEKKKKKKKKKKFFMRFYYTPGYASL